jgi:thiamine-phosphate pyrophosphorylase
MPKRQSLLPRVWLVSDLRNDAALDRVPAGLGVILRHYHLSPSARRARFAGLRARARVLAGTARQARTWGADGAYGSARALSGGPRILRLVTAHSLREIGAANRMRADAMLLSPVFPTRSHPGVRGLGPIRFRLLAARCRVHVIALGGMTARRARRLGWASWAAIDGLTTCKSGRGFLTRSQ